MRLTPGTATSVTVGAVSIQDGTDTSLKVDVLDLASNDALAVAILDGSGNQITSFGGGTQYATNVAYADGNTGTIALTVRDDALSTLTEADGDFSTLRVDSTGALWVNISDSTIAVTQSGVWDEVGINDSGNSITVDGTVTVQPGVDPISVAGLVSVEGAVDEDASWSALMSENPPVGIGFFASTATKTAVSADGDLVAGWADRNGRLHITGDASMTAIAVTQSGTWDEVGINDSGNSITVDNAGTFAVQVDGNALTALQLIDDIVATDDTTTHSTGSTKGALIMGAATPTDGSVNANDIGAIAMSVDRRMHTDATLQIADADVSSTNAVPTKGVPSDIDVNGSNANHADKYYTNAGAVTDGIIWSPAAGKRWNVLTLYINVSAAATVTIEDDLAGGDVARWKGELAANSGVVLTYDKEHPFSSTEDAADLIITTTAGNVYVQAVGYEV